MSVLSVVLSAFSVLQSSRQVLLDFRLSLPKIPQHPDMAPVPPSTSPAKGKTRVYLCRPCNIRHAAPTGARCPIAQAVRGVPSSSKSLGLKRTAPRRSPITAQKPTRPRGRPRKVPVADLPSSPPTHLVEAADLIPPPPMPAILSSDDDSDDASFDDFLPCSQTPIRKRVGPPLFPSAPKRHAPVPALRRVRPPSVASSPASTRFRDDYQSPHASSPRSPRDDLGTQLLLSQLAAMQETNKREFARIEAEGQRERIKLQAEHRATTESLQAAIASLQHSATPVTPLNAPVAPQPKTTNTAVNMSPKSGTSRGNPPARQVPTVRTNAAATPSEAIDSPLTLEGQPPVVTIQPADLAKDPTPIKTLRRDDSTGDAAAIILNGAGFGEND